MFQVVTGLPTSIGDAMINDPNIDLITVYRRRTGRQIDCRTCGLSPHGVGAWRQCSVDCDGMMRTLNARPRWPSQAPTKNSGQRCTAVKRILVHDAVGDEFAALVVKHAQALKYGDPMHAETDIGTVITEDAAKTFERRVNDGRRRRCNAAVRQRSAKARCTARPSSITSHLIWNWSSKKPSARLSQSCASKISTMRSTSPTAPTSGCRRVSAPTAWTTSHAASTNCSMAPSIFGKSRATASKCRLSAASRIPALGYKEGVIEAMKSYTNVKTFSPAVAVNTVSPYRCSPTYWSEIL